MRLLLIPASAKARRPGIVSVTQMRAASPTSAFKKLQAAIALVSNDDNHLNQRRENIDRKNPLFTTAEVTKMNSVQKKKTKKKINHVLPSSSIYETSRLGALTLKQQISAL